MKQFNCKPWTVNGSNEYLHHAIDKSLKEFDISCIDLLIMNRMDKTRPIEQVVRMEKAEGVGF